MDRKRIAVLIPCYNECQTIEKVVLDFKNILPEADIYVYDNNSSDGTDEIAKKAGAIVRYEHRQGKGNVIRTMFREIEADCYLMADGDDTYPADHAREMVNAVLYKNIDMVIGDRLSSSYFSENKRPFHNIGNRLVCSLVNRLFQGSIVDIMTGYRAFSPLFVKSFPILSKGFEIETEMTIFALNKNMNVISIPITYRDRPQGSESKLNTYSDGFRVLRTILRLFKDYRPLLFFSILGLSLISVAILLSLPLLLEYIHTGLISRFPTLFFAIFLVFISIHFFTCGLILDTTSKNARQEFEVYLTILNIQINDLIKKKSCKL